MKTLSSLARLATIIVLAVCIPYNGLATDRNPRQRVGDPGKDRQGTESLAEHLTIEVAFSGEYGQTITDENGTTYHYFGITTHENKVYPPEYWGVFPLYFFDTEVGVAITIQNDSPAKDASLRLQRSSAVLNTDGSNGAELGSTETIQAYVPAGGATTVDASFVVPYTPNADSGLDRLQLKVFGNPVVIYTEIEYMDDGSTIKFGDATEGLGEDGRNETDTFVVQVTGGGAAVSVTTKASTGEETSVLNGPGSSVTDTLGFKLTLVSISGGTYTISVRSAANDHALSHVEFGFGDGATVTSPSAGSSYVAARASGEGGSLLLLKEAIFCPPELDSDLLEMLGVITTQ